MWKVKSEIVGRNAAYYVEKEGRRIDYVFWTERSAQNCADELNQKDKVSAKSKKQDRKDACKRGGRL